MTTTTSFHDNRADLLDTGQWHLAVNISKHGFGAWLLASTPTLRPPRVLASATWQPDEEGLLGRIEDVVYDNPAVLDDYSADIVVECDRQLWLPASEFLSDEDCADAYVGVYGGEPYDVMVNDMGDAKVAFMLTPGLKSFMQRSFPGARIWSQQALLEEAGMSRIDDYKCLVDIREDRADFILLHREELLCASTHPWKTMADIAYRLLFILDTFGVAATQTDVIMSGIRETRHAAGDALRGFLKSVSQKNHEIEGIEIPSAIDLAINRKNRYANHTR